MTRSEAIDMLRQICSYLTAGNPVWRTEPIREACEMAIEALTEKEPSAKDINVPINDCINRQAAIDAITKVARKKFNLSDEYGQYLAGLSDAEMEIRRLPSAERRGKWKVRAETFGRRTLYYYTCPLCGSTKHQRTKYCPDCGAKMIGDDE